MNSRKYQRIVEETTPIVEPDTEYVPDEENDDEDFELDEDPTEEELEAISNGDIEGDEI